MTSERVQRLRKQSTEAVPSISQERALAVTRVYREHLGTVSTARLRAMAFKAVMETKTICINPGELIVGERGEAPQATPTFPELCCHTLLDFDILHRREQISFTVSPEARRIQEEIIIPFWHNRSTRHLMFQQLAPEWILAYEAGIFTEFMEQRGPGHTAGDKKIFTKGFLEIKKEIAAVISALDFEQDRNALHKREQLLAMDLACDALIIQGDRHADRLAELADGEDDPERREELRRLEAVCRHVPRHAPRTFHEAIQMYWFVHLGVITELNPWDSFNPGRLDQHLYPFYRREIDAGTLTKSEAVELLQCLWIKFNNQPAPPKVGVTLKESSTYFDFATINLGGLTTDGEDGVNELSDLLLDVIREMRLLQPGSNVQISEKTPQAFLKKAVDITRTGFGQPSIFNADQIIEALRRQGKSLEDARDSGTSGCVEAGAFGKEAYILTGYFNLPKVLEITLNNGTDPATGKAIGIRTGDPAAFDTFAQLFDAYAAQLEHFINIKIRGNQLIGSLFAELLPVPFLSLVIDDCIRNGKDYHEGGARYNTSYIQGVGIADLTDSLSALKTHLFEQRNVNWNTLLEALADNFAGHDRLFNLVSNRTPKYGNNDDAADSILVDCFTLFHRLVDGRPAPRGGVHHIDMLPTTCHVYFGSVTGALPSGRRAGMPLADGISPAKGSDRIGPTGVISSAARMEQVKTGGTLLNQKFAPGTVDGENGLDNLASIVRAYFKLGGHHIQFNVVDRETLLSAQMDPALHQDLIVRVAGYSDYFRNLDRTLQDEIIARTEQVF